MTRLPSLILLIITSGPLQAADPPAVEARQGMVVAAEPLAAEVGVAILKGGGNAVDAAVAVGFALAVTYPVAGNIGGGGFLVASLSAQGKRHSVALDFREMAPAAAHRDLYVQAARNGRKDASTLGHLAAGVPGSVAGLLRAHQKWGRLDRDRVLAPAIRLAEEGFPMPERIHAFFSHPHRAKQLQRYAGTRHVFYPGGKVIPTGALFRQPELAETLRRIRDQGADGFYRGEVAEAIVREMERGGGVITLDDLASYQTVEREPVTFQFRGLTVISMPPPSSGGVCLQQMLTMLDRYPLEKLGHNSSISLHLLSEAMRRSFADRNLYLGDPDHHSLPLERMLSKAHLEKLAATIDAKRATPSEALLAEFRAPGREGEQTTHYSVVDAEGNAVAVTTTLNGGYGSKVVVPGAGFLLNNEMDDFATEPGKPNLYGLVQGEANAVGPRKRPLSSMTPTVVLDVKGQPCYVLGTPGGPTIISNVLQVFLNLVVYQLPPQAAVNTAKIHHQCIPDRLYYEKKLSADVLEGLRSRGHRLQRRGWIGDFQLIAVDRVRGVLLGVSDPRGEGRAVGY
ncbi:MAG: gamma-glutamyltransferase [Planctomycetota bacterium]